jgi:redox-sensing transcriptional repressor
MKIKGTTACPEATLKRLPSYLRLLKMHRDQREDFISCTTIAEALNQKAIQVRKDLAGTGISGKPRTGYAIDTLIEHIENYLGWNNSNDAFLVGVGNLGRALLGYQGGGDYNLNIVTAFDTNETLMGQKVHDRTILPMDKFKDLAQRMHVNIGIITVPPEQAQGVADIMIEAGIMAIWNFAPTKLTVHPDSILVNTSLSSNLAILTNRLHQHINRTHISEETENGH